MDYPVATDRELLIAFIDELGVRYDDINTSSNPDQLRKWVYSLLVQWSEEYGEGYHQQPAKNS